MLYHKEIFKKEYFLGLSSPSSTLASSRGGSTSGDEQSTLSLINSVFTNDNYMSEKERLIKKTKKHV